MLCFSGLAITINRRQSEVCLYKHWKGSYFVHSLAQDMVLAQLSEADKQLLRLLLDLREGYLPMNYHSNSGFH